MKYFAPSVLLITAFWTVQAIPTAIPSSLGGRARGLPYNAVRSIHTQRKLARQESTAAGNTPVPDVTSVLDIPTADPLPPTTVGIVIPDPAEITSVANFRRQDVPPTTTDAVTSEPTAITSDADVPTTDPLPPTTTNVVITSEPTAITSVLDVPTTTELLLPPTTTDVITSELVTAEVPQTFLIKVRQESVTIIPTPIDTTPIDSPTTVPTTPIDTFPVDSPTAVPTTPIETFPVDSPTAVPTTPIETFPVDSPTAVPTTPIETFPVDSPTAVPTTPIIDTFVARSPFTDTASPPTTTS